MNPLVPTPELRDRLAQRTGPCLGLVVARDTNRPGQLLVRVESVHPTEPLGWAIPLGVAWGTAVANYLMPPVGARVAVWFLDGNPAVPCWMPGAFAGGNAPPEVLEDGGAERRVIYRDDRGVKIIVAPDGALTIETAAHPVMIRSAGGLVTIDSGGGGVEIDNPSGIQAAAREGDPVQVEIPIGAVLVASPGGPVPNAAPIPLTGSVTAGSSTVRVGG